MVARAAGDDACKVNHAAVAALPVHLVVEIHELIDALLAQQLAYRRSAGQQFGGEHPAGVVLLGEQALADDATQTQAEVHGHLPAQVVGVVAEHALQGLGSVNGVQGSEHKMAGERCR